MQISCNLAGSFYDAKILSDQFNSWRNFFTSMKGLERKGQFLHKSQLASLFAQWINLYRYKRVALLFCNRVILRSYYICFLQRKTENNMKGIKSYSFRKRKMFDNWRTSYHIKKTYEYAIDYKNLRSLIKSFYAWNRKCEHISNTRQSQQGKRLALKYFKKWKNGYRDSKFTTHRKMVKDLLNSGISRCMETKKTQT